MHQVFEQRRDKSSNTPAPSELPTRNQYKGMLELANKLSNIPAKQLAMALAVNRGQSTIVAHIIGNCDLTSNVLLSRVGTDIQKNSTAVHGPLPSDS